MCYRNNSTITFTVSGVKMNQTLFKLTFNLLFEQCRVKGLVMKWVSGNKKSNLIKIY